MRREPPSIDWTLWITWVLATTLGWAVGWAIQELTAGLFIGLAQWFVLRDRIEHAGWWILASAVGWAGGRGVAVGIASLESAALIGAVVGAGLGIGQWMLLQQNVDQAWWWIVVSSLSWAVALTAVLGEPLVGAIAGFATGLALEPLLRYAAAKKARQEDQEEA